MVCSDDNERVHQCVWQTYVLYIVPNVGTLVVAFPGEESDTMKRGPRLGGGDLGDVEVAWTVGEALSVRAMREQPR